MKRIVTREEMRQSEQCTILEHGVSSLILMERAALSVYDVLRQEQLLSGKTLIVCGSGNNGGDGLAIARILFEHGYEADVVMTGDCGKHTSEVKQQLSSLKSYGIPIYDEIPKQSYTVIIDAIFGIGLTREISGIAYDRIAELNSMTGVKVAVDLPSGIDTDTGRIMGIAFHADLTVTFAFAKLGMYSYPGTGYCGRIVVCPIGILLETLQEPYIMIYDSSDRILPERRQPSHKGTYGKVLLIAGSEGMCGAAILAAEAVLRAGAGMVRVVTTETNGEAMTNRLPEAMQLLYHDGFLNRQEERNKLADAMEWADVIGIGSGMSVSDTAKSIVDFVMENGSKPMILDADALNLLARRQNMPVWKNREVIITPHIKEMERLSRRPAAEITDNPYQTARDYASASGAVCVLKDARTVIAAPDGNCILNTAGNSGMATAGSGDVLTGIICAMKAQGLSAFQAASAGVTLHARAGDHAAEKKSEYGMIASDMIKELTETESEMNGI